MNRFFARANKRVSLANAAILLIVVALLGQGLGFLRTRLINTNFKIIDPGDTDAFFTAFQIPDFFFLTITAGALGVAFVPVLADRIHAGDKKGAWELTNSLLNLLSIAMLIVGALIFVFAAPLLRLVGPGLDPDHFDKGVTIMRLLAFNPLLFTISGILTSVQQTFGRFFFYAIAPLTYNLAIILSIYIFKDNVGIVGLGIGALLGGIMQLVISCFGLWGLEFKYRRKINMKSLNFRQILRQLPARSVDQGVDSINSIVEINRASQLGTGAVSHYQFATTLMNVPIMLLGNTIATAAFPRLTERLSQKRPDLFHKDFFRILRIMIWIAMPIVVISYFGRGYLVRLILGGTDEANREVVVIFGFLTIAIFFRIVYAMISRYFYAQKDTRTPLFVSLITIAVNIILVFILATKQHYGVAGLALAQSIAAALEVTLLVLIMLVRDPYIFNGAFWGGCMRILSVTGFTGIVAYVVVHILPLQLTGEGFLAVTIKLSVLAFFTLLVHVGISALFGLEEAKAVIEKASNMLKRVIEKPVRIQ